jgi:tetraacyldisaccharide 4'-kinase
MLARQLPGVPVLVSGDRYLAGRLAEHHFGTTVHLLDDGFQHLQLDRDVDLVIVNKEDLEPDAKTLPSGRLREPGDVLVAADAVLAGDPDVRLPREVDLPLYALKRSLGTPVFEGSSSGAIGSGRSVLAVAGIANPERFLSDLRASGWVVAATILFRDHHAYSLRDVGRIRAEAAKAGAAAVITTEKDFVRLLPFRPFPLPVAYVPLTMEPQPATEFRRWLEASLRAARDITVD